MTERQVDWGMNTPSASRYVLQLVLLYVLLAGVWTVFWHRTPSLLAPSSPWLGTFQAAEDWLFVFASTGVLVFSLVRITNKRYHFVFENMREGFAYCRVLFIDGQPRDFVCLDVNRAFYELTGLKTNVVGQRGSDVMPGLQEANPEVLEICGRVARTGVTESIEVYLNALGSRFAISVYRPRRDHVVAVFDNITERKQAEEQLKHANERLATQMGHMRVLQRQLHDLAVHDPLMHIYNRNYLAEVVPLETTRARRQHDGFGVLLVDIDHFKLINDTHGHAAGDEILQSVARTLTASLRAGDIVCRYGGDEILCLLTGATCDSTLDRAEHLRQAVADMRIDREDVSVRVTVSIGAAVFPLHGLEMDEVVKAADLALYRAKADGRNRVQMGSEVRALP